MSLKVEKWRERGELERERRNGDWGERRNREREKKWREKERDKKLKKPTYSIQRHLSNFLTSRDGGFSRFGN